jgi:hypothetical protein
MIGNSGYSFLSFTIALFVAEMLSNVITQAFADPILKLFNISGRLTSPIGILLKYED